MLADQACCLDDRRRRIADREYDVIAEFFPGAPDTGRRARDALRLCHQVRLAVVHAAPGFDVELLEQRALQTGLHHGDVGHYALAAQ